MIERAVVRTFGPFYKRLEESLFSLNIRAYDCEMDRCLCSVCYTAGAWGRSIESESVLPEFSLIQTQDTGNTLESGIRRGSFAEPTAEYIMLDFTWRYLRTMRAIMEGKQGIIAFDLLSLRYPHMMECFEKVANKVFGTARETLVIYIMKSESRTGVWEAYLKRRGITKEDWVLGF